MNQAHLKEIPELGQILNPKQLGDYLGLNYRYVIKHWKELGGIKIGKKLFFPRGG